MRGLRVLNQSIFFLIFVLVTNFGSIANAAPGGGRGGPFGLGIILGDPTGITAKYNLDQRRSIDGGFAFAFDRWTFLYVDALYHFPGVWRGQHQFISQLSPYIGVGGMLILSSKTDAEIRNERYFSTSSTNRMALGMRIPLGIEWRIPDVPVGVFVELVPGLTIVPGTFSFFGGGIGARYFF